MRTRKPGGTYEKILDVTEQMILRKGYEGSGLEEICKRTGITKAALFYHFEGKEELFRKTLARYHERNMSQLKSAAGTSKSARAQVLGLLDAMASAPTQGVPGCPIGVIGQELSVSNKEFQTLVFSCFQDFLEFMENLLETARKERRPHLEFSSRALAKHVLAVIQGSYLVGRATKDPEAYSSSIRELRSLLSSLLG